MKDLVLFMMVAVWLVTGCATIPPAAEPMHVPKTLAQTRPQPEPVVVAVAEAPATNTVATKADTRIGSGMSSLRNLAAQTEKIEGEFGDWWKGIADKKKRVLTSEETDRAGSLLFRYRVAREMLWDMVSVYTLCDQGFEGADQQTRAFTIGYCAAVLIDCRSARLVGRFIDEPVAYRKLNEIHARYDIPADFFDALFLSVTSPKNIQAIREAHKYVSDEMKKSDSVLAGIVRTDPEFAQMVQEAEKQFAMAQADTDRILKKKSLILPGVANVLRQTRFTQSTRNLTRHISDNLYFAQGVLFNNISDIKQPMTSLIDFNPDQVALIKSLLQPGDLLFTFTDGYMSNVFLPGKFKHGLTYIGTPEQRRAMGLTLGAIRDVPPRKRAKLEQDLANGKLPTGYDADIIEAVAEGVIFNSLDYLLKHHVNRIAVLRPRVNADERVQALGTTFLLLGSMYDFNFDFVDTSYQCCTEVIYRSYNKKGGIEFPLIQRMAVKTLAADDIIGYHLASKAPLFDFVVFAQEEPGSILHMATVHTGTAGARRLHTLMTE